MAFFNTPETNKRYQKINEQTKDGTTTAKFKNGMQNLTVIFNEPSEVALKRFANTLNDIVTDIANKRASA